MTIKMMNDEDSIFILICSLSVRLPNSISLVLVMFTVNLFTANHTPNCFNTQYIISFSLLKLLFA